MAHAAAGGESHLAILEMKAGARQKVEISGVVVMEMREDHAGDIRGIDIEQAQRFDRAAQPFALASIGGLFAKARVDQERAVAAARDPDEIIEVGGELVRIGEDEILGRMPVAEMRVAYRENFKRFCLHDSPHARRRAA